MNLRAIEHCVKNLNHEDTDAVSEFHKKLYRELHMRKKALFLSKGMVFLDRECCAHVFNYRDDNVLESLARDVFGSLFIIVDEFLIYNTSFKNWQSKWCKKMGFYRDAYDFLTVFFYSSTTYLYLSR